MALPRFRFADAPEQTEDEFWRDVAASDRLGSRFKANLYLRELCRTRVGGEAGDIFDRERREADLLRTVAARGYRVFGPDLASNHAPSLAHAG